MEINIKGGKQSHSIRLPWNNSSEAGPLVEHLFSDEIRNICLKEVLHGFDK